MRARTSSWPSLRRGVRLGLSGAASRDSLGGIVVATGLLDVATEQDGTALRGAWAIVGPNPEQSDVPADTLSLVPPALSTWY